MNPPWKLQPNADEGRRGVFYTRAKRGENKARTDNRTQVQKSVGDENREKTETRSKAQNKQGESDRSWHKVTS